jgi:hypothetical protein
VRVQIGSLGDWESRRVGEREKGRKGKGKRELWDSWGQGTCQGPDSFLIVEFVAKIRATEWIIFRAA